MAKDKAVIGIDLGATKMLIGVLEGRRVLAAVKTKTDPGGGPGPFLHAIAAAAKQALAEAGRKLSDIRAVGAGCPAAIYQRKGKVRSSANIPFLKNYPHIL